MRGLGKHDQVEQDRFLDVWCEQVQIHDLGKTSTTDMADSGKLSLVGNLAALDQVVEADGEGHHFGDARYAAWRRGLGLRSGFDDGLGSALAGLEFQFVCGG